MKGIIKCLDKLSDHVKCLKEFISLFNHISEINTEILEIILILFGNYIHKKHLKKQIRII